MRESDESGVGFRLAIGRRVGIAHSSGVAEDDIAWAAREAAACALRVPENPLFQSFPDPKPVPTAPTPVDRAVAEPDLDRLFGDATLASTAMSDAAAVSFHSVVLRNHSAVFAVANTLGVATWDRNAYETLQLEARTTGAAEKGASEMMSDRHPIAASWDLEALARATVDRAREGAANPRRLPHVVRTVILDATTTMQLLIRAGSAFSGTAALMGRNPLPHMIGQQVAAEALTLTDAATGPNGARNQRVDDEGVPTRRNVLVERGILKTLLYDNEGGRASGHGSTGNGLRPIDNRYAGLPHVAPANLEVTPGSWTLAEMVESAPEAVLIRDNLLGAFAMNALTGDFSVVAPLAFHVEGGKVAASLVSTTLAGNLYELLQSITAVGGEAVPFRHGRAVPLSIGGLTCAT
jgi:PmbA protein